MSHFCNTFVLQNGTNMERLKIQIHRLSYKVLMSQGYLDGKNEINITPKSKIASLLSSSIVKSSPLCDKTIYVISNIKDINIYSGGAIYHFHKQMCLDYILHALDHGRNAFTAMQLWYNIHDIDDDDYSQESMYREWQRYYNSLQNVDKIKTEKAKINKKLTRDEIDEIAAHFTVEFLHHFYNKKDHQWRHSFVHHLYAYIIQYTKSEQPKKVKFETLRKRAYRFGLFLSTHEDEQIYLKALIDTMHALK